MITIDIVPYSKLSYQFKWYSVSICCSYQYSRGRVRVGGELSEEFQVKTGLRQGCPLSCMLFNLALEWVMQNTAPSPDALTLTNGFTCDRLAYADDADLCGETYRGRDRQIEDFDSTGKRVGLDISEP